MEFSQRLVESLSSVRVGACLVAIAPGTQGCERGLLGFVLEVFVLVFLLVGSLGSRRGLGRTLFGALCVRFALVQNFGLRLHE